MEHKDFKHENVKLGKQPYKHDDRTLQLARFFKADEISVPSRFDFDANRKPFPMRMWGNDEYGDCEVATQANALIRLERVETWQTINLQDTDAINRYKALTGCQTPGDENDTGLIMLDTNRNWRNQGFATAYKGRNYKIDAYGELDPMDDAQVRMAIFLLHGAHFGFSLPYAAQKMTNSGVWDYKGETGSEWEPGSWGGHAVYGKKFTMSSIYVLTWEMEIEVTDAFRKKYADETWGVVDSFDAWRKTSHLDVSAMEKELESITAKVNA